MEPHGLQQVKAGELAGPSSLHHTFGGKHVLQQMAMAVLEASVLAVFKLGPWKGHDHTTWEDACGLHLVKSG